MDALGVGDDGDRQQVADGIPGPSSIESHICGNSYWRTFDAAGIVDLQRNVRLSPSCQFASTSQASVLQSYLSRSRAMYFCARSGVTSQNFDVRGIAEATVLFLSGQLRHDALLFQ